MGCHERFVEGDSGAIMLSGYAQHRECSLRAVRGGIGHLVNHAKYCGQQGDPDAGLGYRKSALLVWAYQMGAAVTEKTLERARESLS